MPSAVVGTVRSLERDSNACTVARAGDNVAVTLQGVDGNQVMAGDVLCHPDFPVAAARHLELKVLVLDGASPILVGTQVCSMQMTFTLFSTLFLEKKKSIFFLNICSWSFIYTMRRNLREFQKYCQYLIPRLVR